MFIKWLQYVKSAWGKGDDDAGGEGVVNQISRGGV